MKSLKSVAKIGLLSATLFVTGLGFSPKAAEAWLLILYCEGGLDLCAIVDDVREEGGVEIIEPYEIHRGNLLGYELLP